MLLREFKQRDRYLLHRVAKYRALYVTDGTYSLVTDGLNKIIYIIIYIPVQLVKRIFQC